MHGFATPRCLAAALTAAVTAALLLPATSRAAAGSLDRGFHGLPTGYGLSFVRLLSGRR